MRKMKIFIVAGLALMSSSGIYAVTMSTMSYDTLPVVKKQTFTAKCDSSVPATKCPLPQNFSVTQFSNEQVNMDDRSVKVKVYWDGDPGVSTGKLSIPTIGAGCDSNITINLTKSPDNTICIDKNCGQINITYPVTFNRACQSMYPDVSKIILTGSGPDGYVFTISK